MLPWRRHKTWFAWLWLDINGGATGFCLIIHSSWKEAFLLLVLKSCFMWLLISHRLLRALLRSMTSLEHGMLYRQPLFIRGVLLSVHFSLIAESLRRASFCLGGRLIAYCCNDIDCFTIHHRVGHVIYNSLSLQYITLRRIFEASLFPFLSGCLMAHYRLNRFVLLCPP